MRRGISAGAMAAVVALGTLLPLAGCSDMLEPKVYGSLTPETFFSSEADFRSAVVALYVPFTTNWGNNDPGGSSWYAALYNADPKSYWSKSESTTDELYTPWDGTFENFTWGPSSFNGDATYWKIRYVARATDAIDKIQNSSAPVTDAVKKSYVAEAKALRGWLDYILYDMFGPVNAKLDPATLSSIEITPRPTAQEFSASIEKDLTEAIADLPAKYNTDAANWGRMSKGVARMVLLRLYMHDKAWSKAEAVARDLTNMGYSLLTNYTDLCTSARNNELIYAVPANASSPNWYFQEIFPSDFKSADGTPRTAAGWYGWWMPWSYYDKYSPGDKRLTTILASYTTNKNVVKTRSTMNGAIPMKCMGNLGDANGAAVDWPVFRYAEVLLSLSEALNEQGKTSEAFQYVNQVRARAGVPAWSGLSQAALRDSIFDERARELYAEGVRRGDLIRAGKFISSAVARGASAKDYNVLFAIPANVIQEGGTTITQNPGY